MSIRLVPLLALALAGAGCRPPGGGAPAASPEGPAARRGMELPDPAAPGLGDLARVSRYVFREMALRGRECGTALPLAGGFDYVLDVEVAEGRVSRARLASVTPAGAAGPLPPGDWPPALASRVRCLEPFLVAMAMDPAPADGVYATRFSVSRAPGATPGPALPGLPDPGEAGISDLARVARYVFRKMRTTTGCSFANPLRETLEYELEVEVAGGSVVRAQLVGVRAAAFGGSVPLVEERWPPALRAFVDCLEPRLEALAMAPAPADGSYRVSYASPGSGASDPTR